MTAPPGSRQVAFCARWDSQVSQVAPGELCARWARWSVRQVAPGGPCARWTFGIMSAAPRDRNAPLSEALVCLAYSFVLLRKRPCALNTAPVY